MLSWYMCADWTQGIVVQSLECYRRECSCLLLGGWYEAASGE